MAFVVSSRSSALREVICGFSIARLLADDGLLEVRRDKPACCRGCKSPTGKIDDGSYGKCSNCGGAITPKRLEAIPWTTYCVTCQELI